MTRDEETELVRRWQRGDKAAADALLQHTCCKIRPALARRVSELGLDPNHDTEDILQEALAAATKKVVSGSFDPNGPAMFSTYCFHIATKKATDLVRRRKPWVQLKETTADQRQSDPAKVVADKEAFERLVQTVEGLPEPGKTIFCLRHGMEIQQGRIVWVDELTEEEIGRRLGYKRGWVSTEYTKAKATVARILRRSLDSRHEQQ